MSPASARPRYQVRLEWGLVGALSARADVAVVVDVLSFSTSVCIAVGRGMRVLPYAWDDAGAESFARRHDAVLAVGRGDVGSDRPTAPSLSPSGLLTCRVVPRIVLPSPNGSSIAAALQEARTTVLLGCLRNATAVAERVAAELRGGATAVVVAAGERWAPDGSLRPAHEDHLGAGAVFAALETSGYGSAMSPQARNAATLFRASEPHLLERLTGCLSGQELIGRGYGADVEVAAERDASRTVPKLYDTGVAAAERASVRTSARGPRRGRAG